jgi:hypothetical protein
VLASEVVDGSDEGPVMATAQWSSSKTETA